MSLQSSKEGLDVQPMTGEMPLRGNEKGSWGRLGGWSAAAHICARETESVAPSCFLLREHPFLDSGRAGFLISYRSSLNATSLRESFLEQST